MTILIKLNVENFSRSVPESTLAQIRVLTANHGEGDARVGRDLSSLSSSVWSDWEQRVWQSGAEEEVVVGGLLLATTASLCTMELGQKTHCLLFHQCCCC